MNLSVETKENKRRVICNLELQNCSSKKMEFYTNDEILKLETWLNHISYTFWGLLDGLQGDAFNEYLSEYGDFRQSEDLKEV